MTPKSNNSLSYCVVDNRRTPQGIVPFVFSIEYNNHPAILKDNIIWPKLKLLRLIILVSKCMIGLIPELFPNAKYVLGIMTGSMEPYLKKLRRYAGWLPLVCADYGASEGWIAANVNPKSPPESATFTVIPDIGNNAFAFTVDLGYQRRLQTIA
ncbi:hypothetical protein Droror1_Dr00000331 [Drosera rotundifolia]